MRSRPWRTNSEWCGPRRPMIGSARDCERTSGRAGKWGVRGWRAGGTSGTLPCPCLREPCSMRRWGAESGRRVGTRTRHGLGWRTEVTEGEMEIWGVSGGARGVQNGMNHRGLTEGYAYMDERAALLWLKNQLPPPSLTYSLTLFPQRSQPPRSRPDAPCASGARAHARRRTRRRTRRSSRACRRRRSRAPRRAPSTTPAACTA